MDGRIDFSYPQVEWTKYYPYSLIEIMITMGKNLVYPHLQQKGDNCFHVTHVLKDFDTQTNPSLTQ